jgi:hypothetical protein
MILPVHGIMRGRIKKFGMGKIVPVPTWLWSMLLGGIAIAIFCVTTKLTGIGGTSETNGSAASGSATSGSATSGSATP